MLALAAQVACSRRMLVCMRTTINLPDSLGDALRARAAAEGRTITSLIEEGLRAVLQDPMPTLPASPLPSYGNPNDGFLVDLGDREALWAVLDARRTP